MDTIVIAPGMPFFLAFLDQPLADVMALWASWVESGELVQTRIEQLNDPVRDAAILLRPAAFGVVQFVPNDPPPRDFMTRIIFAVPTLHAMFGVDTPPERSHYWTSTMLGLAARPEKLADGKIGLVLSSWDFGRI